MSSLEAWRAAGSYFEWQGAKVFYRTGGTGEPLVAIHGFPTASWDWAKIWPDLTARYRVIALDMIGFGFSDKPRRFPYSVLAETDLWEAFIAREGIKQFRMLSHDYGDSIAQELLARDPSRVIKACFLNGGMFPEAHHPAPAQRLVAGRFGAILQHVVSRRTFAKNMRGIWGKHPLPEDEIEAMWQLLTGNGGKAVMHSILGYIAERKKNRERWVGAIVNGKLPRRFICGLLDPVAGAETAERYKQLVPSPDIVELADVGHYPQVEAPERVAEAILAFL